MPEPSPLLPTLDAVNDDDLAWLTAHLGRTPRAVRGIALRATDGTPRVIVNHPFTMVGGRITPFPTLLWLTRPHLCRELAQLEMAGTIAAIEQTLRDEPDLQAALNDDHRRYIAARAALLSPHEKALVQRASLADDLLTPGGRGIGGIKNTRAVKCLHMHVAQHLVHGNTIGKLLEDRYGLKKSHER